MFTRGIVALLLSVVAVLPQEALTNDAIVRLLKAGMSEGMIVQMVNQQPGKYTLDADAVIQLKQAGATDGIIAAMIHVSGSPGTGGPGGTSTPTRSSMTDSSTGGMHTWSPADPNCTSLIRDGQTIRTIKVHGLEVSAAIQDTGWKTRANLLIVNNTTANVDVQPETFTMVVLEPKHRELRYDDPYKLAKSIQRKAAWNAGMTEFGGGMARKRTTSHSTTTGTATATDNSGNTAWGTYNGSTTTTTSQPDYEARQRAAEKSQQIRDEANNTANALYSVALQPNTILPTQQLEGAVFFEREKHIHKAMLTVVVGGDTFVIPFENVTAK